MLQQKRFIHIMGTIIEIWLLDDNAEVLLDAAENQLMDYDRRFSANNPKSELMNINQNAGIKFVPVSADLFTLIKIGKIQSTIDNSFLNIAIGPLIQTWRIGFNDARYPSDKEIKQQLKFINPNNIILDESNNSVFLTQPEMAIDLGALAKGFFADKIIEFFKQQSAKAAFINLGGNVLTFGDCPFHDDGYWRVGIQNPFQPRGNIITALKIKNQSVVTSGIYERTFSYNGKTYHHIFDSRTGYPVETDLTSITIVSKNSLNGEIWTTQLYGASAQYAIKAINKIPDIEGMIVTINHKFACSDGLLIE
ncbi:MULTISPECIES: FAD:protein FMN transferase [unclassified Gilliamella]|uniref:FAD:protein FMN transferase n=1 Tax=unclassified Gilliamella TaxID=2685620 RepID=UPI00226995E6|nr:MULTISPECIES: FAD:protein FMN transferase [unclassified Gilliamella]MCX8656061.1 FAD:protein FMN transferase [Gilliamella sp. B2894]MCX8664631.1 FAD:protein FMN transferase [Gilliamella sp. B2887]MCX8693434.1 FAD:protein FMN transferase [Gilliamella sp. B2881]MCX8695704.1 FAD:protein FMN transferase [Gilliamella sp. B2828]MCX8698336.1 FAD:protein FMN transferase [Gilliamella sp. B3000]